MAAPLVGRFPLFMHQSVIDQAVGLPAHIGRIACGSVSYDSLTPDRFGEDHVIDTIGVYCKGNWLRENHHIEDKYTANIEKEMLCGEYGSIMAGTTQDQARQWFLTGIRYYMYYSEGATQINYQEEPENAFEIDNAHTVHQGLLANGVYINDGEGVMKFPGTFEEAYRYAVREGEHRRENDINLDVTSTVITTLVSLVKRGNITPEAIEKIQENCRTQIGKRVVIPENIVKTHYSLYTPNMSPANIRLIVVRLLAIVPASAIKIRTMVQQCAFSGLSSYVCVKDALGKFADFQWGVVEALFPGQLRAFHDALITIGGNQYYAFRHGAMGHAASTNYAILGWTARSLLIETGVQPELKRYGGGYKKNKYPRIAAAIQTYVERPLAVGEDGAVHDAAHPFWTNCLEYLANARAWVVLAEAAVEAEQEPAAFDFGNLGPIPELDD